MGKKHRGAGNRGGRGRAGLGKRGAQKKTLPLSQGKKPVGKIANNNTGMKVVRKNASIRNTINLSNLSNKIEGWVKSENAKKTKETYSIDLSKLGYDKLLSDGELNKKINVNIAAYSVKAKEKLEAAGGKIQE
jgi:large subunit ribosomal protein L15